jgi:hypothetical protein
VTLCATIPGDAMVMEVALFGRAADSNAAWSASRFLLGQQSGQARFAAELRIIRPGLRCPGGIVDLTAASDRARALSGHADCAGA